MPAFPNALAFEMIERELGRPLDEIFETISEFPVAAASLGQVGRLAAIAASGELAPEPPRSWQVYKAVLRSTGETVAVKVQRPGIEPVIYRDLWLLRALSFAINAIAIRRLGCNATLIIDEFGEKLLEACTSPPTACTHALRTAEGEGLIRCAGARLPAGGAQPGRLLPKL